MLPGYAAVITVSRDCRVSSQTYIVDDVKVLANGLRADVAR